MRTISPESRDAAISCRTIGRGQAAGKQRGVANATIRLANRRAAIGVDRVVKVSVMIEKS
jgi:hypothetical protein